MRVSVFWCHVWALVSYFCLVNNFLHTHTHQVPLLFSTDNVKEFLAKHFWDVNKFLAKRFAWDKKTKTHCFGWFWLFFFSTVLQKKTQVVLDLLPTAGTPLIPVAPMPKQPLPSPNSVVKDGNFWKCKDPWAPLHWTSQQVQDDFWHGKDPWAKDL